MPSCPAPPSTAGFSLIELLVVIGLVAILASLLLPTINRVRYQALSTQCASNMRSCVTGALVYSSENENFWPYDDRDVAQGSWCFRVGPYLDDLYKSGRIDGNNPFHCPFAMAECPGLNKAVFADSLSYHFSMNNAVGAVWDSSHGGWFNNFAPKPLSCMRADTVAMTDATSASGYFLDFLAVIDVNWPGLPWPLQSAGVPKPASYRIIYHGGRVNRVHLDGHTSVVSGTWDRLGQISDFQY